MRPGLRDNTGRSASRSSVVSIESAGDGAGNIKITLKNTIKTWLDNLEVFKAL